MKTGLQTSVVARCLATLLTGVCGLGLSAGLMACGQKGPLTLPTASSANASPSAAASAPAR